MKSSILAFFFVAFFAANVFGATYYIDFVGGLDGNNGTSISSAWQRHPYMRGFGGRYTHSNGDRFIFKGGVTWPNAAFPLSMNYGGTASASDYYGVDQTWYSGGSWTRPIFNAGGTSINNSQKPFIVAKSYIIIDGIEFTGFYWDANTDGWGTCMIDAHGTYINIANCYFHNWSHASAASGCADDLDVIWGGDTGCVATNCIFDGAPNGTDSGRAANIFPVIRNSIARNCSNGFTPSGDDCEVSGCDIGPINSSFCSTAHPNGIEPVGNCDTIKIFNNVLHDCTAVTILTGSPGNVSYIYNNFFYNSISTPIQLDGRGTADSGSFMAYIYNNTIVGVNGGVVIRGDVGTWGTADIRNNHIIDGSINVTFAANLIKDHNLLQTKAQAASAGYTMNNFFKPSSANAPTIDAGVNLASVFNMDHLGVSRPRGVAWDIGAYEYATNVTSPSLSVTPTSQDFGSIAVGMTTDRTFTVQNMGGDPFE